MNSVKLIGRLILFYSGPGDLLTLEVVCKGGVVGEENIIYGYGLWRTDYLARISIICY